MTVQIDLARPSDAPRIAELHVQAFSANALMHAIHGPPSTWQALQESAEAKFLADVQDAKTTVLVAQDGTEDEDVVGYAVWVHDLAPDQGHIWPAWNLPETTNWDVLKPWKEAAAKVAEEVVGDRPHYELSWLVVSPEYARRGIGTMLTRCGLNLCEKEDVAAYVESTVEAAETFYAKAGFVERGRTRLELGGQDGMYEEVACVYEPKSRQV